MGEPCLGKEPTAPVGSGMESGITLPEWDGMGCFFRCALKPLLVSPIVYVLKKEQTRGVTYKTESERIMPREPQSWAKQPLA